MSQNNAEFNLELLARKAVDRIKSEWGLPLHGFLAGGSLANIIWEYVSGTKAVVNDIDIFILDGYEESLDKDKATLFNYKEIETRYFEDYNGMSINTHTKDFYRIVESKRDGIFNQIYYKSNVFDISIIIKSFDINATRVGYDITNDKFYWTSEFEDFLKTGELKITNLMTPSHTAIRIAKKSEELNAKLNELEYRLVQYAINYNFNDRIKLRFLERYTELYHKYSHLLKDYFFISRDTEAEEWVKMNHDKDVQLNRLVCKFNDDEKQDLWGVGHSQQLSDIFKDENLTRIYNSDVFLFYIRNIHNNLELREIWPKLHYFFDSTSYIDKEMSIEDIDLLHRFVQYAPNSIRNLKGFTISEQIDIIKKFLDKYKEDPIVAISIIENVRVDKDIVLDDQTSLILELSVRKQIVNDTKGKVRKILNLDGTEKSDKTNSDPWVF